MPSPDAVDLTLQPAWPRLHAWLKSSDAVAPVIITATDNDTLQYIQQPLALAAFCPENHSVITPEGCTNCRLLESGNHPDRITVGEDKATITIKQVRLMRQRLATTPLTDRRLVLIPDAEKLSPPAVNALLKSLEEPQPTTRFALLTRWPNRLPATIRSRCQRVRLSTMAETSADKTKWLASRSLGEGWPASLLERLKDKRDGLTDEELAAIAHQLGTMLRQQGPSPALRRAYQRLRDYHVIKQSRGNTKVAADVVLASLP